MKTIEILEQFDRKEFDALAPHPLQSFAWGEVREATGIRVVRFGEFENGKMIAVYQMTVHKLPKVPYYIGYIPRSLVPSMEAVSFMHAWAKKEKIIFIKWEPYQSAKEGSAAMAALPHMRLSRHPLFTEWNQEVSLLGTPEEVYQKFKKNTRYSIRRATELGATATEMSTDEGFQIFSDLYFGTVKRQEYHGHTRTYHKTIWKKMSDAGIAKIFVAFFDGKPQAAFEIFFWHDRAYYPYSGSADANRHVPATQLLMWQVIQDAKKAGLTTLDLWGSLPEEHNKKHPWAGFTLFKSGFGSQYVHMTKSHDQVVFPALYHLYSGVYFLRSLFWKKGL